MSWPASPGARRRCATPPSCWGEVGVFLGTIRPPAGSPVSAATGWIGGALPALVQCGREHRDGVVIWNLFHQIGHILQFGPTGGAGFDPGTVVFVEFLRGATPSTAPGRDADRFASLALLGPDGVRPFDGAHTADEIRERAANLGVRPGVAARAMQRAQMLGTDLDGDLMEWIDPTT